jgi:hypothetical protein
MLPTGDLGRVESETQPSHPMQKGVRHGEPSTKAARVIASLHQEFSTPIDIALLEISLRNARQF